MFKLSFDGALARLQLDRPGTRNAIPVGGWAALGALADTAQRSGASILIISSTSGAFCAGADLGDFQSFKDDPQARSGFREKMRGGLDRLRGVELPTIAVIEGACYGAGVALAMACDIRFAGPGAHFAITPAKLGISYPQEDVHRLVALVGAGHAARLLFGAEAVDGAEAARIGLVEYCAADVSEAAERFAASVAANDRESLFLLKRGIGLATAGVTSDPEQDRSFDALLGRDTLFDRLAERRSGR